MHLNRQNTVEQWGKYKKCGTCLEYGWTKRHKCPPEWAGILLEDLNQHGADPTAWIVVYGRTPTDAAIKYVLMRDQEEATFTETSFVVIQDPRTNERTFHRVEGELVPTYSGHALSSDESAREQFKSRFTYDPLEA